jgi:membrane protein CcdC involved in cytochrome C biogenesis
LRNVIDKGVNGSTIPLFLLPGAVISLHPAFVMYHKEQQQRFLFGKCFTTLYLKTDHYSVKSGIPFQQRATECLFHDYLHASLVPLQKQQRGLFQMLELRRCKC